MGKLANIKTKPTEIKSEDFLNAITEEQKRKDSFTILSLMEKVTGEKPKMWGASMIGFGDLRYKSPTSGREVDWFKIGFSPRKANFSIHLAVNVESHQELLQQLGKHKTGSGCLYINKLEDINLEVLENILADTMKKK